MGKTNPLQPKRWRAGALQRCKSERKVSDGSGQVRAEESEEDMSEPEPWRIKREEPETWRIKQESETWRIKQDEPETWRIKQEDPESWRIKHEEQGGLMKVKEEQDLNEVEENHQDPKAHDATTGDKSCREIMRDPEPCRMKHTEDTEEQTELIEENDEKEDLSKSYKKQSQ
ncbi:hypothetical protein QQF64_025884 [Cirrhinus molitorella]|uniref:Uncharacterized protein n=1 Tax=Cirrhinus molitorella TaxID=172907 RepID=A0ABR3NR01_9TELE